MDEIPLDAVGPEGVVGLSIDSGSSLVGVAPLNPYIVFRTSRLPRVVFLLDGC